MERDLFIATSPVGMVRCVISRQADTKEGRKKERETTYFPLDALSIPGLFDAMFTDEELVETVDVRFIAVGFDFATILSSSFCSCILFAIVLGQLDKLKF